MDPATLFADTRPTAKQRSTELARLLTEGALAVDDLVRYAATAKDAKKAICLEAFEQVTRSEGVRATEALFDLAVESLSSKAPAVQREAGRVIGNIAHHFPKALATAIPGLLANATHEGTVVRWSAAFALGEILKMRTPLNTTLLPKMRALTEQELKDSIRKIHHKAIKAVTL